MGRPTLLSTAEVQAWLSGHEAWQTTDRALIRTIQFANFRQAFSFMTQIAMVADTMDHHPEWFNVYGRVDITITTHDVGGITELDTRFAEAVETALGERGGGL